MTALLFLPLFATTGWGFVPVSKPAVSCIAFGSTTEDFTVEELEQQERFHSIATKLRTSVHGHGFDSRDPNFGVETVKAAIPTNPSLGLELYEVAHSTTQPNRGLVLVSGVGGNAAEHTSIQEGDTIVGVSCLDYKESTAGLDYDATMDAIVQAKTHSELMNEGSITLQLHRLVPRAAVTVIVERENGSQTVIEGLAGDDLRLLLKQNGLYHSANDCGGEGIWYVRSKGAVMDERLRNQQLTLF